MSSRRKLRGAMMVGSRDLLDVPRVPRDSLTIFAQPCHLTEAPSAWRTYERASEILTEAAVNERTFAFRRHSPPNVGSVSWGQNSPTERSSASAVFSLLRGGHSGNRYKGLLVTVYDSEPPTYKSLHRAAVEEDIVARDVPSRHQAVEHIGIRIIA